VPYSYLPPDELRKRIARTLYAEQHPERPDWIDEQLLRPGQVAALFQVSRRTISDWARAGKLDAIITPGGHRRFRATQVRALLEAQKVEVAITPSGDAVTPVA
jgi:excisionase family DNA binding protein